MLLTALAYLLIAALAIAALAIAALAVFMLPVYVWILARDRAADADMAEARRILGKDFPA